MIQTLLQLAALFGTLSLLAVGGANGVVPAMQHAAVDLHQWMTHREFLALFALSRVAPGPGSLIATLIGQRVAGLPGAAVATLAMFAPSCLLVYAATRLWGRFAAASWRDTAERGLAPIAIGLTFASGIALMRGTEHGWAAWLLTAASTAAIATTSWHPLLPLGGAALAGLALGL